MVRRRFVRSRGMLGLTTVVPRWLMPKVTGLTHRRSLKGNGSYSLFTIDFNSMPDYHEWATWRRFGLTQCTSLLLHCTGCERTGGLLTRRLKLRHSGIILLSAWW